MADSKSRTQFFAGIFVLCGLVLLGGLILEFGPLKHWMRKPYTVYAVFSDAQSLIKGSPVRRAGTIIGKVASSPDLVEGLKGVKVALEIYPEYKLPEGTELKITSIGLMGDGAVDVVPPPQDQQTGKFVEEGATLSGMGGSDMMAAATKVTDEATEVMKDIRAGLVELNKTIARLNTGVLSDHNLEHLSESLEKINASIDKIESQVLSEENTTALRESLALLKTTLQNASTASTKADSALAKMDKAMDHLGPGLKGFAGASSSLNDAADALEALLKEARSGRGLLYSLLNNAELRDNLERLIANLRRSGMVFYKDRAPPAAAPAARPATPAPKKGQEPWRKR